MIELIDMFSLEYKFGGSREELDESSGESIKNDWKCSFLRINLDMNYLIHYFTGKDGDNQEWNAKAR